MACEPCIVSDAEAVIRRTLRMPINCCEPAGSQLPEWLEVETHPLRAQTSS